MQSFKATVGITKYPVELDNGNTLYMNPYDIGIISRYKAFADRIKEITSNQQALGDKLKALDGAQDDSGGENQLDARISALDEIGATIADLNRQLGEVLDEIFQTNVAEVCCGGGTLFDPTPGGGCRFETILSGLMAVCTQAIGQSARKSRARLEKGRGKYVPSADDA